MADLESVELMQLIETNILEACLESPNGSTTMASLLANKPLQSAGPGLYLMAATNLCCQGKVWMMQELPRHPNNLAEITITLIHRA